MARNILRSDLEFAVIVGPRHLRVEVVELAELGHAFDQAQDFLAKFLFHLFARVRRVFQHIVQQPGGDRRRVQAEFRQDAGHGQAVLHIRFARGALLAFVQYFWPPGRPSAPDRDRPYCAGQAHRVPAACRC